MSKKGQKYGSSDPKSTNMANGKAGAAPAPATTNPPANAWSQPLRPKPSVASGPPPGMGGGGGKNKNHSGSGSNSGGSGGGSVGHQNALRERFISLSLNLVGLRVIVTQTNGAVFEGIFHTFSPFQTCPASMKNKYVIKACKVIKPPTNEEKGSNQVVDQSTVIIGVEKVACLTVKSMRIDTVNPNNSNGSSMQQKRNGPLTDTEISGGKGGRVRDLVPAASAWTTGPGPMKGGGNSRAEALMGGLEDNKDNGRGGRNKSSFGGGGGGSGPSNANSGGGLKGSIGQWDQFRANEELFNVKSNFDESFYTTELDKSTIDNKKIVEAERLAREIESKTSDNIHIAEERGQKLEVDYDEEERYSSVISKDAVKAVLPVAKKAENDEKKANSSAGGGGTKKNDVSSSSSKSAAPPRKVMNYAAAAAKADPAKKSPASGPPGFSSSSSTNKDGEKESAAPEKSSQTKTEQGKTESTATKAPTTEKKQPSPKEEPAAGTKAPMVAAAEEGKGDSKKTENSKAKAEGTESKAQEATRSSTQAKPAEDTGKPTNNQEAAPAPVAATPETTTTSAPPSTATAEKEEVADAEEKPSSKVTSKLNANAKEFTLNATAKVFTPGAPVAAAPTTTAPPADGGQFVDPNAGMHPAHVAATHMPGPHYIQAGAPMVHGQPGMMPMMNPPQFPGGVRYAAPGYGMDQSQQQHMQPQMQPQQPQHVPATHGSGAPSPGPGSAEENNVPQAAQQGEGDAPAAPAGGPMPQQQPQQPGQPPQQQQQQPGQQQVQMPYGVPPGGPYYAGQMMHPQGPRGPHPGYGHPQFVGAPPQMVGQAGGPYRHVYPMGPGGIPPNVQVRPGPYYGAPMAVPGYPPNTFVGGGHNMMDEDPGFRGGQRGGRGGPGRGRGRGRRAGRGGRGGYNSYHQHGGGRHSGGQNQNGPSGPSDNWSSAPDSGNSQPDAGGGGAGGGNPGGPAGANQSGKPGDKAAKQ